MKITLEISVDTIANLMVSAIESGDPVTSAHRGGWCTGINLRGKWAKKLSELGSHWYASPKLYESGEFTIEIVELLDESKEWKGGNLKKHRCNAADFARGFSTMAKLFPHQFAQVVKEDTDAPCADAFLQAMLFGEEKYA